MILVEHDAKVLLGDAGIPVPAGMLVGAAGGDAPFPGPGPWAVKAQVPVGGRGLAGAIRLAASAEAVTEVLDSLLGSTIRGHAVTECRVEVAVTGAAERYVSLAVDPAAGAVRVLAADSGGVHVERDADALRTRVVPLDAERIADALVDAATPLAEDTRAAISTAGPALASAFIDLEATLLEINPLFVRPDGTWLAGDAKVILDDNALPRLPGVRRLVDARRGTYPDVDFKLEHGYDFFVLDEHAEVGLLTTGAGLSMQLVEELATNGLRAYDFCDVRTGQLRGDPTRLVEVLRRLAGAPAIRCTLVNFFAGITDLVELATLLRRAVDTVPDLRGPLVVRLDGGSFDEAAAILEASPRIGRVHRSLNDALAEVGGNVRG